MPFTNSEILKLCRKSHCILEYTEYVTMYNITTLKKASRGKWILNTSRRTKVNRKIKRGSSTSFIRLKDEHIHCFWLLGTLLKLHTNTLFYINVHDPNMGYLQWNIPSWNQCKDSKPEITAQHTLYALWPKQVCIHGFAASTVVIHKLDN